MTPTAEKLITLAAKRFKADAKSLKPSDDFFQKLKINSLQALSLLSDIEMEFKVEIPDYELQAVNTFAGLAEVIDRRK